MLKNIKSSYFIEKILSYLEEKQKLKLIRYNKDYQKKMNVNINNYKHISGNYIIYISKEIGKEYKGYDDSLRFEGEYLNGRRSGKGKEYYDKDKLKFDGEYLNGKRNGIGKEYDSFNKKLIYEGEYLNGLRNGKGKEYYDNGALKFDGEYLDGKQITGTKYDRNGTKIYQLNNKNGIGKEYGNQNMVLFEGEYLNGKKNGRGKKYFYYKNKEVQFEGEYKNGLRNGEGKE